MKKLILSIAIVLTTATSAFAQLGSLATDLVFTPVTPCRIVDTRAATGGAIQAKSTRNFWGWSGSYTAQGGSPTNCGLPYSTDIAALSVNLVVIGPATEGWIAAFPYNTAQPLVSNLNFRAGDVLANSAILKISQEGSPLADWSLYSTSTMHFVADVTGYYSKPVSLGSLACVDTAVQTATIAASGATGSAIAPACASTHVAVSTFCVSNSWDMPTVGTSPNGTCYAKNNGAISAVLSASQRCCRIPGR